VRKPARGGRDREQRHPDQEHAPAPDQIADPPGEEQEASVADQIAVDNPGQVLLGEVERALDRRKRDVYYRRIDNAHQVGEANDDESDPAGSISCSCFPAAHNHHPNMDNL
jgi:hypothetical protein